MFRRLGTDGKTSMRLGKTPNFQGRVVECYGWEDVTGGSRRHFLIRPRGNDRYHVRVIVNTQVTTDLESVSRKRAMLLAKSLNLILDENLFLRMAASLQAVARPTARQA